MGVEEEREANQQAAANPVEVSSTYESYTNNDLERIIEGANVTVVQ